MLVFVFHILRLILFLDNVDFFNVLSLRFRFDIDVNFVINIIIFHSSNNLDL